MMDVLREEGLAEVVVAALAGEVVTRLCVECVCVVTLVDVAWAVGQSETSELKAALHIRKALGPKHLLMGIPFASRCWPTIRNICFS